MEDKLSIAMTTYNGEKYLREQLNSIYCQTMLPDEVIVCDDCSTDETINILQEFKESKGLKYFINNKTLGVNKNYEKAIKLCTGNYVGLCDQDDIWMPTKIEKSIVKLKEIEKKGLPSLVTSQKIDIDQFGKIIHKPTKKGDADEFYISLFHHDMQGCTMFMNRNLLNYILPLPYDDDDTMFDAYIGITAAMIGNKYIIGEPLMYYRRHEDNLVGRYVKKRNLNIYSFNKYFSFYSTGRVKNFRLVKTNNFSNFLPSRIDLFEIILDIACEKKSLKKIKKLFLIQELSIMQKIQASVYIIFWIDIFWRVRGIVKKY